MLDNIYDLFNKPQIALLKISEENNALQSSLLLFTVLFLVSLGFGLNLQLEVNIALGFALLKGLTGVIFMGCLCALWHFLAELFGFVGKVKNLFCSMGYIYVPIIFLIPLYLISALLDNMAGSVIGGFGFIMLMLWVSYLLVVAISVNYNISYLRSVVILIIPPTIMLLLSFIMLVAIMGLSMQAIGQIGNL